MKIFDDLLIAPVAEYQRLHRDHGLGFAPDNTRLIHFGRPAYSSQALDEIECLKGWHPATPGELFNWYEITPREEREKLSLIVALGATFPAAYDFERVAVLRPDKSRQGNPGFLTTTFKCVIWAAEVRFLAIRDYALQECTSQEAQGALQKAA